MPPNTIEEPARQIPVYGDYDVVVLGGGPAGIAAGVAAARAGRRTLLIERYGFLGGMGTAAGVTNFCGLHANVHGEMRRVVQGIAVRAAGAHRSARRPERAASRLRQDPGAGLRHRGLQDARPTICCSAHEVDLLFHALGAGVVMRATSDASTR